MPAGGPSTRECPFCSYTGRSDHVNRHVKLKHPFAAVEEHMPDGYTTIPGHPKLVVREIPLVVNAVNRGMLDVEEAIKHALTQTQKYYYPAGFCYECDHAIYNDEKSSKSIVTYTSHVCKAKAPKPWKRREAVAAKKAEEPEHVCHADESCDAIEHVPATPVPVQTLVPTGNPYKEVVTELMETDVGDLLREQVENLTDVFDDEDDDDATPVPVDSKEVLVAALRQAKKADAAAIRAGQQMAPLKSRIADLSADVEELREANERLQARMDLQRREAQANLLAAVELREDGMRMEFKKLSDKKDAIIMALATRLGAELGMSAEDILEFEV